MSRLMHAPRTRACSSACHMYACAHANCRTTCMAPPAYLLCAVHGWEVFRNCDTGEWGQKPRFGSLRAAAIAPQSPNPLARGPALTTGLPRPLHVAVPNGPTICPLTTTNFALSCAMANWCIGEILTSNFCLLRLTFIVRSACEHKRLQWR